MSKGFIMKIVFVTAGAYDKEDYSNLNLLGTEYQIFGLSKELVKKGHEVYIFRRWFENKFETINGVNLWSFRSRKSRNSLVTTFSKLLFSNKISKVLKSIEIDILIIIDPFTSYFTLKLPITKVSVIHNEIPLELLPKNGNFLVKIKNKFLRSMQNKFYTRSDCIVALNEEIKGFLEKKGYPSQVIPNGIDINDYVPYYSHEKFIIYGGRIVKPKRINDLIKAYSLLNDKLKMKYKLIIIGEGSQKHYLEKLVLNYGLGDKVKFIPWLASADFINEISKSSVFVLPSLFETFGVTTIEAMALGKPVIVSDTYGSIDIVTNGYDGFIFKKRKINQLKYYLDLLLENEKLRLKMGKNARKTVEENYTFDKISNEYIRLFNYLLN